MHIVSGSEKIGLKIYSGRLYLLNIVNIVAAVMKNGLLVDVAICYFFMLKINYV